MSFLSVAFLVALPLAAAPILLHLFDRRRNVVIEWGAMQFLMEAATRRTSARKLKQWLLLLMRVGAVAALVLALARPMLPGQWFGSVDRSETVIVIDNSMSMLRNAGESTLFAAAIDRAIETINEVATGDAVRVLLASPYPVWATDGSVRIDSATRKRLADQLRELRTTDGGSDLLAALFAATQAEIDPSQQRRRIVLLTDGQAADWKTSDENGWKRYRNVLEAATVPTQLDVVELERQAEAASNLAVNGVETSRIVVGLDQSLTFTAEVQNYGPADAPPSTATWKIQDAEMHASHVPSLSIGETQDVAWQYSFDRVGVYSISCELDADDTLAPDNSGTVVVEVVNDVPIVLLETAPELAEMQRDAFFVEAALGGSDLDGDADYGVFVPSLFDAAQLERIDLSPYRAVVIPNLQVLSAELVDRLRDFVEGGGGLWLALGPRTDVEVFNELLFDDGNGLSPLAVDRRVNEQPAETGTADRQTRIDPFARDHPATAQLSDTNRLDTGEVTIDTRFRFIPPPEGEPVSTLLALTNGEPLAVEKYVGRGRVIVQAVPLRMQWSELARSQAFVVMLHDWLAYLTQPRATRHNLSPGDAISVLVADRDSEQATLRTPHGDEVELTAEPAGDAMMFRTSRTILPGDYWLEWGLTGEGVPFHVRRHPAESNLAPLDSQDQQLLAEVAGLSRTLGTSAVSGTNRTDPLWPLLLMLLIALIAGELMLSGSIARERFGSAPIAETAEPWTDSPLGRSLRTPQTPHGTSTIRPERHEPVLN